MYKIIVNKEQAYLNGLEFNYKTVDFAEMCAIKNIKPKLGFFKRVLNVKQRDRVCRDYPCAELVANWFGLRAMPLPEFDQPSSWSATVKYIETMYGPHYAKGFERADYPKLRKAA